MPDSPSSTAAPDLVSVDNEVWHSESTESPVVDAPAEPAAPSGPAQTRDNQGRFTVKTDAPPSEPETPAETPPAEVPPDNAEGTEPPVVEGETPPEEPAQAVLPPWEYTVSGRQLSIPGSKVGPDGVFIPTAQVERVTRHLIAGHMAGQRDREAKAREVAARNEGQAEVLKARKLLSAWGELTKDKAKVLAFAEDLERNRELYLTRAELEAVRAEKEEVGQRMTESEQTQAAEALVPQLQNGLKAIIGKYADKYAGVDTEKLYDRLMRRHFDQVFSEDEQGEILIDEEFIEDELQFAASAIRQGREAATKETKAKETVAQVTKENAARTGQAGIKPPPMAGVGKGGKPSNPPAKKFTNTRDADRDIWDS